MDNRISNHKAIAAKRKKKKTWKSIVSVLACIVVFCTTYALILPAITMEAKTYCGTKEHVHGDGCYTTELVCTISEPTAESHEHIEGCYVEEKELICTLQECEGHVHAQGCYDENGVCICGQEEMAGHAHDTECYTVNKKLVCELVTEESPSQHIHTESCYKKELTCKEAEHSHTKICYSNKNADVETASDWERTLPKKLSGVWAEDVLAVADSQLGYTESTKNYIVTEDGKTKGYSRYGDWYGDSYGDWCAMFVSFCLNYAEVDKELMPYDANCQHWIETLSKEEYQLYHKAGEYDPVPGDLIFFNWDKNEDSDHVGFVYEIIEATDTHGVQVKTIEGNASNTVKYRTYDIDDKSIMGYGQLPEKPEEDQDQMAKGPMMFAVNRAGTFTGIWSEDIYQIAKSEVGYATNGTPKYGSWGYGFVNYCLENAKISTSDIPRNSNLAAWVSDLKASGLYRINGEGYEPKPGDIVFLNEYWGSANITNVGVVSEIDLTDIYNPALIVIQSQNNSIQYVRYGDGSYQRNGILNGYIEIPKGEITLTGSGLTAKAEFSLSTDKHLAGAALVINELGATAARDQLVADNLCSAGNLVQNNHYYEIYFEKNGSRVVPNGTVHITLEFSGALDSNAATDELAGDVEWRYATISNGDASISELYVEDSQLNAKSDLSVLKFRYANDPAYVFSSTQGTKTKLSATDNGITVIATAKSTVLSEEMKLVIQDVNEHENASKWVEALESKYNTTKLLVSNNQFLTIEFQNADGSPAELSENVDIDIEVTFNPELSAAFENGVKPVAGDWKMNYITDSASPAIEDVSVENKLTATDDLELSKATFKYQEKDVYAFSSVVVNPGYSVEVDSYEEFAAILSADEQLINIKLTADIIVPTGSNAIDVSGDKIVILNLNGKDITTSGTLVRVSGEAEFTLIDSEEVEETTDVVAELALKADDDGESAAKLAENKAHVGELASYNSSAQILTYYVTESQITNSNEGASKETLIKYTAPLQGVIQGSTSPVFVVESGTFNMEGGAITGCSNSAIAQTGGTLNLEGGYLCGNQKTSGSGGAIEASGDSKIVLNGAVIAANKAPVDGGAISIRGNSFTFKSGVISGNEAGSSGGGVFATGSTSVEMDGGYLTNNVANTIEYRGGGGGMFTNENANIVLNGGYVTGNYAESGGGGIRTFASRFRMMGGIIASNYANRSEGGGLSINEYGIGTILGGYVNNNVSNTHQHWGGGGIFASNDCSLFIRNIIVTDNDAGGYGGGVAGCSTGRAFIYDKDGGAIYDNTAVDRTSDNPHVSGGESTKAEDHLYPDSVFREYGYEDYFCAFNSIISGTMLGGEAANWVGSKDGVPIRVTKDEVVESTYLMGLQSNPTTSGITAAQAKAQFYVNGNDSYTHGGGILGNGYLVIGGTDHVEVYSRLKLEASKKLDGAELEEGQFEFVIENMSTGYQVATATNDKDGNVVFSHMIPFTEEAVYEFLVYEKQTSDTEGVYDGILMDTTQYKVTVDVGKREEVLESDEHYNPESTTVLKTRYYIKSIQVEKKNESDWEEVKTLGEIDDPDNKPVVLQLTSGPSFTNIVTEKTSASVLKKWAGDITKTEVEVQLLQDGEAYGPSVKLNEENNWSYKWSEELPMYKLQADGSKHYYKYTVQEINVSEGVRVEYETFNKAESSSIWVPYGGNEIVEGESYIVVSPDNDYVLLPSATMSETTVTSENKHPVSSNSIPLTVDGKIYSEYFLDGQIPEDSIFKASDYEKRGLALRRATWQNFPLTVDGDRLKVAWWFVKPIFVNDVQVTVAKDGTDAYDVIYADETFKVAGRGSSIYNLAQLYTKVQTDTSYETIFTITNSKEDKESIRYKLDLTKVSADDANVLLSGAEFALYHADQNGEADLEQQVVFRMKSPGSYEYAEAKDSSEIEKDDVSTVITAFGGKLVLTELPKGDYVLVETKAPNGYLITDPLFISFGEDSTPSRSYVVTLEDEVDKEAFILPETGGPGTNVYTAGGILLLMISVLLYIKGKNQKKGGQTFN